MEFIVLTARNPQEIDAAFATLSDVTGAVFVSLADAQFRTWRKQIVAHLARHELPSIYGNNEYVEAGALSSYGSSILDAVRLSGNYVYRILKGENPAGMQPGKFVPPLNLTTATTLGIAIPASLLAAADEVIE